MTDIRAVLFDFGGVLLSSPIDGFRAYERDAGPPAGFLQRVTPSIPTPTRGPAWSP